jgi:acylpyruvate hydrolase
VTRGEYRRMKLVTYEADGVLRAGIIKDWDGRVVDAASVAERAGLRGCELTSVRQLLRLSAAERAALAAAAGDEAGMALADLRLAPPVPDPTKVLCIGLNYRAHAAEADQPLPGAPIVFAKFRTSLIGEGGVIRLPATNPTMIDYEGELAVVIGRRATDVAEADALDYVAGYMPFNDVSARDLQLASPQWTMGKAFDTSGPCGPTLVLSDEVPDPQALTVRTIHRGDVVQEAPTSAMIFSVAFLVAYISSLITLEVGDIIATGTPSGVGHVQQPPRYLTAGDSIVVEIDGVGRLTNSVMAAEQAVSPSSLVEAHR